MELRLLSQSYVTIFSPARNMILAITHIHCSNLFIFSNAFRGEYNSDENYAYEDFVHVDTSAETPDDDVVRVCVCVRAYVWYIDHW